MVAGQGFPRARRVRKRREYLDVQGRGRRVSGRSFLVFVKRRESGVMAPQTRFGITVTRKVGNAVTRNRIKRLVRETCRKLGDEFPRGNDIVLVARPSAATMTYRETEHDLRDVARRLRAGGKA